MKLTASQYKAFMRKFLATLGLGAFSGGLEITDNLIRLAYFDGRRWQFNALRLEPDVLEKGKIKDPERFIECLSALKASVPGMASKNKKIDVTVALGESAVYNQVFSLPFVEGKGFVDAVRLNMQMASPTDISEVYSGWEISGRDMNLGRVDVLGAFSDRAMIDEMTEALFEAGFVSSSIESKALALARIFRTRGAGIDPRASYLLASIDDAGFDFLILRSGKLYFEYGTPWRDLADARDSISVEKFRDTLTISLRQIMNFFLQHWPGTIAGVAISGGVFADETKQIAEDVLSVPAFPLMLTTQDEVSSSWYVAMGASLRETEEKEEGAEVTLLGEGARETFEKDKILRFAEFWSFSMPVIFIILVGLFMATNLFLVRQRERVFAQSVNAMSDAEHERVATLRAAAASFNQSVAFISSVEAKQDPKYRMIQDIMQLAATNSVIVSQFSFAGYANPATLAGLAQSQAQIVAFQAAVEADPRFGRVTLPLTGIQSSGALYSFSMTFLVNQAAAKDDEE
jgi:hypothetical protein